VGRPVFSFILGREHLKSQKYKIRNKGLLERLGIRKENFVMLGVKYDHFKDFEEQGLPVLKFEKTSTNSKAPDDACLCRLKDYFL